MTVPNKDIIAALREPRRRRLSYFVAQLQEHRHHPSFRAQGWAYNREMGFTCRCDGTEREWRVDISLIKDMVPEARDTLMRMYRHQRLAGNKMAKRKARRANRKAKALLHRHLTKEQRWEMRATKSFEVTGQDGRTYRITEGRYNNVHLLEGDEIRYSLCVVSALPVYDLLLAHKLLLEVATEDFLRLAIVRDERTNKIHPSGDFIVKGVEPSENPTKPEYTLMFQLPNQVLDDPKTWIEQQLREKS